jgi:peptide/nickel transport system substrate-binding protein
MMSARSFGRAALLAGTALAAGAAQAQTPPDVMVMARAIDAISTFDPAQIGEVVTNEIILNTCDSLVELNPDDEGDVIPALAEDWSVSDDGMQIVFNLRQDAVFPSGNPVTAEDVAWSMKRVLQLGFGNSATLTEWGFTEENAEQSFVAVDDHTFQVNLSEPYPVQLILQAVAANRVANVLDRETVLANEVDGDLGNQYLTTNTECVGPYRLARWNAGEVVILEANENYYGDKPAISRWIIRHVGEAGSQRLLLEQGDVDIARDLGAEDFRDLSTNPDVEVVQTLKHQIFYMGFDSGQERFADDRVRLAFKYLIDYDALGETVMAFDGVPRASVVPIGAYAALDEDEGQPFSLDIEKARQLLEEAGYGDGFTARLFIGSQPYSAPIAQHVQANAAQVGITLEIERMADAQLFSAFRGRDFDTVMLSWSTSIPHAHGMLQRHAINPDNSAEAKLTMYPTWRASWYNPDFNERVRTALMERDEATQLQMYADLQRDHMNEGPFAYMFQIKDTAVIRDRVENWKWHAFRVYYDLVSKN